MKKLAIVLFGVFALATSAKAVVYDFVAAEAAIGEQGFLELGGDDWAPLTGLSITGSTSGGAPDYAYLDGPSGNPSFPGGLGVCGAIGTLNGVPNQCIPSSDDSISVSSSDVLTIDILGAGKRITDITFNPGGQHGPSSDLNGQAVLYSIDGAAFASVNFEALSAILAAIVGIDTLDLKQAVGSQEFYLASMTVVPVPAAVWLFGTAMLGLFGMRRKAKMGAVAA